MQMNALAEKFGDKLAIIGFPSNQFGHQTNEKDCEILNTLKYVRPGDGYEPKFQLTTKVYLVYCLHNWSTVEEILLKTCCCK